MFTLLFANIFDVAERLCKHRLMNRINNYRGPVILSAGLILIFAFLPLGTAIQFGGDEGYELMKAFLRCKGFALYREIWSDQPPLFTLLLDWAFRLLGPSILTARCVTAGFSILLFTCYFDLIRQQWGAASAWFATFFLLASPVVLELSISVMQEVPTFALVMLSVWALSKHGQSVHVKWLWTSGLVMGIALEIKLIAALVLPAVLAQLALSAKAKYGLHWKRRLAVELIQWGGAAFVTFSAIGLGWGEGSFQAALHAHFGEMTLFETDIGGETPQDFVFSPLLFLEHADVTVPALCAVFLAIHRQRLTQAALPIFWLVTASAVHFIHRPWWSFYYIHLAIPLAWLAGITASQGLSAISRRFQEGSFQLTSTKSWPALLACGLTAVVTAHSLGRLDATIRNLKERPEIEASMLIGHMKAASTETRWVYADNPIYAFHARLLMPPELAVVTLKRFWSGQINTKQIIAICRQREVDQLLLGASSQKHSVWTNLLADGFIQAIEENGTALFYSKTINSRKKNAPFH